MRTIRTLVNGKIVKQETTQKQEIIIEKDYPARRLIAGTMALPMLLLLSTIIVLPLIIFSPPLATRISVALPLTIIAEILTIWWALSYAWPKEEWKSALSLVKPTKKQIILGLSVGLGLMLLLQLVGTAFSAMGFNIQSSETSTSLASLSGGERILVFYILSPLIVPVIEELFFRGYIMNALRGSTLPSKGRTAAAVIISSVFFAMVHIQGFSTFTDIFLPVWIFVVALSSALLVVRFKTIWIAVASHVAYNSSTVILSAIAGSN